VAGVEHRTRGASLRALVAPTREKESFLKSAPTTPAPSRTSEEKNKNDKVGCSSTSDRRQTIPRRKTFQERTTFVSTAIIFSHDPPYPIASPQRHRLES
jgi:hypothetical protein